VNVAGSIRERLNGGDTPLAARIASGADSRRFLD